MPQGSVLVRLCYNSLFKITVRNYFLKFKVSKGSGKIRDFYNYLQTFENTVWWSGCPALTWKGLIKPQGGCAKSSQSGPGRPYIGSQQKRAVIPRSSGREGWVPCRSREVSTSDRAVAGSAERAAENPDIGLDSGLHWRKWLDWDYRIPGSGGGAHRLWHSSCVMKQTPWDLEKCGS